MSYLRQLHNKCEKSKCFYFPVRFLIISLFHKMRKGCNSVQSDVPKCVTTGQLDFVLKVWRSNHQSFPVNKLTVTLWRIATLVCASFMCLVPSPVNTFTCSSSTLDKLSVIALKTLRQPLNCILNKSNTLNGILELICLTHWLCPTAGLDLHSNPSFHFPFPSLVFRLPWR